MTKSYNLIARLMHWASAIVIFIMFGVGLWMVDLSYYSKWYQLAPHYHRSIGILLSAFILARILWKFTSQSPEIEGKRYEIILAKSAHALMYVMLGVIFISGYLISTSDGRGIDVFNWFTVPSAGALFTEQSDISGDIHFYTAVTLMVLVSLHVLAALKHHFIDKDDTLKKMLGASK
ncbi:cytochrome b [Vibrio sagamiensis]|uniref:Cytochrome b n=1 Tax=Vibrio sagamiensis NBRC 104589 TaxID=1219064 RepID=A0A511QFQ4_9VIBR|nr:cytochrome b [Vibrio sagamiensis]PNQ54040.1 cytochrome b [Vibrio agarivorans]GEM76140.1 cytochrome b [Vibrio sagamiensis NBRC 104589]